MSVVDSPAGEASAGFKLSVAARELKEGLHLLESVRGAAGGRRGAPASAIAMPSGDPPVAARLLGEQFFAALTENRAVYGCYSTSLIRARDQKKGLRLRLRIEAPELAVLPWEYLFDPQLKRDHLSLHRETPIVRHLETELPVEPIVIEPPIEVLCMIGNSRDLNVEGEREQLKRSVEHLTERGVLRLTWVEGHTWRALQKALRSGTWHVFHFIGHGGFDPASGEGCLELEREGSGEPEPLAARNLGTLLAVGYGAPKLVVLNSCDGARASEAELISSTAAMLAARGIPAVVSMQFEITDQAALEFSRTFYDTLADGKPVDEAVSEARMAIRLALAGTTEWGTPVLHMRTKDGTLFRLDLARTLFRGATAPPPAPAPAPAEARPVAVAQSSAKTLEGLKLLAQRVRQYWVDGVLASSLDRAARIEIGKELMPGAVASPWAAILDTPDGSSEEIPPDRTCRAVFDEVGRSLLILGEPGAGKTITLLELARDLLQRNAEDPSQPVEVVFNLSSWAAVRTSLAEWMVEELSIKYQIPKKVGRIWLADGQLLPLLDGLDEVKTDARAACVDAINAYTIEESKAGLAVCCRLKEYLEIPTRLALNGALRLQPLSREQVFAYLAAAGPRLAALNVLLERDSGLLLEARTPLMLSLMARAYADLPAEALEATGATTLQQRRKGLMDAYVARMFRLAGLGGAVG